MTLLINEDWEECRDKVKTGQQGDLLAADHDNLSLPSGNHTVEGEKQLPQVVL